MDQNESNNTWAGGDAEAWEAAGTTDTAVALADTPAHERVLARLPDLDAAQPARNAGRKSARSDGRLISPRLSTKLLISGGILLVLAAIVPLMLKRKPDPEGGKPPAPGAEMAPVFDPNAAQTPTVQPGSPNTSYQPNMTFNPEIPEMPDFINPTQGTDAGAVPQTPAWEDQDQTRRPNPDSYLDYGQSQTDAGEPQARSNQTMTLGDRPLVDRPRDPFGEYRQAYRADPPEDYLREYQADSRAEPWRSYPARPTWSPPSAEPGVARLEGIIQTPPIRTTYDRARSSVH